MTRTSLALLTATALVVTLGGCASDKAEYAQGGVRLLNGTLEVQFCDTQAADMVILSEKNDASGTDWAVLGRYAGPLTVSAGQIVSFSSTNTAVKIFEAPALKIGDDLEFVAALATGEAEPEMLAARFHIDEPGLPTSLWQTGDGLLLEDPCA